MGNADYLHYEDEYDKNDEVLSKDKIIQLCNLFDSDPNFPKETMD